MRKFVLLLCFLVLLAVPAAALQTEAAEEPGAEGLIGNLYLCEKYGFTLTLPTSWLENVSFKSFESTNSLFKYQLNVIFYPKDYVLQDVRLNVATLFAILEADYTEKLAADGITEVFRANGYVYACRTYENIYADTPEGRLYGELCASLAEVSKLFIPFEDRAQALDKALQPVFEEGYLSGGYELIPMRRIFEALGYTVSWDGASWTASAKLGSQSFSIPVGAKTYHINGKSSAWKKQPLIREGRLYIERAGILPRLFTEEGSEATIVSPLGFAFTQPESLVPDVRVESKLADGVYTVRYLYVPEEGAESEFCRIEVIGARTWETMVAEERFEGIRLGSGRGGQLVYAYVIAEDNPYNKATEIDAAARFRELCGRIPEINVNFFLY